MAQKNDLFIPVILGTARRGRRSENAARFMVEQTRAFGFETECIDVRDYLTCFTQNPEKDELIEQLKKKIIRADGYIIVTPEYNHGYPGELKMLLDNFYDEYFRKVAALCGVSSGGMGGARVVEMLKPVLVDFHMAVVRDSVYFSNAKDLFDEHGNIREPEVFAERAEKVLEEVAWWGSVLKEARNAR